MFLKEFLCDICSIVDDSDKRQKLKKEKTTNKQDADWTKRDRLAEGYDWARVFETGRLFVQAICQHFHINCDLSPPRHTKEYVAVQKLVTSGCYKCSSTHNTQKINVHTAHCLCLLWIT